MKRNLLAAAVFAASLFGAFAQASSPMDGWYNEDTGTGKINYYLSDHYYERDGYAIVDGQTIHYWLYDTITNHSGSAADIYNEVVPSWAEGMGYVVDYDNIYAIRPNDALATSVRTLMSQRGSDVSVALVADGDSPYIVINECFNPDNDYKTTIYPLRRR